MPLRIRGEDGVSVHSPVVLRGHHHSFGSGCQLGLEIAFGGNGNSDKTCPVRALCSCSLRHTFQRLDRFSDSRELFLIEIPNPIRKLGRIDSNLGLACEHGECFSEFQIYGTAFSTSERVDAQIVPARDLSLGHRRTKREYRKLPTRCENQIETVNRQEVEATGLQGWRRRPRLRRNRSKFPPPLT
jgi:hypothetical protein